jgi:trk system potassium uptake protein
MAKSRYIVVVGCGRLGALVANQLSRSGHSVVIIDTHVAAFRQLSAEFSGFRITGDATELGILREAQIHRADCLLAVTDRDNLNLMVTQIAKTMFEVPMVIARVYDPAREDIYREFGIATISPTQLSAQALLDVLFQDSSIIL